MVGSVNTLHRQGTGLDKLSLWELRDVYEEHRARWTRKLAAEVAFALAVGIKRVADDMGEGFKDKKAEYLVMAKKYAADCLILLKELPAETMSDVSTDYTSLAGVTMPNYFYPDYVSADKRFPNLVALLK